MGRSVDRDKRRSELRREVLEPETTEPSLRLSWILGAAVLIVLVAGAVDAALWRAGTERDTMHRKLDQAEAEIQRLERELHSCRLAAPAKDAERTRPKAKLQLLDWKAR